MPLLLASALSLQAVSIISRPKTKIIPHLKGAIQLKPASSALFCRGVRLESCNFQLVIECDTESEAEQDAVAAPALLCRSAAKSVVANSTLHGHVADAMHARQLLAVLGV